MSPYQKGLVVQSMVLVPMSAKSDSSDKTDPSEMWLIDCVLVKGTWFRKVFNKEVVELIVIKDPEVLDAIRAIYLD